MNHEQNIRSENGMAQEQLKTISKEDYAKVKAIANIVRPLRSFLFKTPVMG